MAKRQKIKTDAAPLTSNPFAALRSDAPALPDAPTPAAKAKAEPAAEPEASVGRLVVRRQKKGQGGKTVTCIEGLPAGGAADLVAKAKPALGCSGRVDGSMAVLGTGDHRRVADWLREATSARVVLGN